jgi:hypothetical protein
MLLSEAIPKAYEFTVDLNREIVSDPNVFCFINRLDRDTVRFKIRSHGPVDPRITIGKRLREVNRVCQVIIE